ncbi:MAG: M1 family metallopeptidase [Kiritimatiellae bacterium]|nr:M1 family metallopeptidase [Kiritimatiellia bacterium]
MTGRHRYARSDFGPLPVRLEHVDIHLNFVHEQVEGAITLHLTAAQDLQSLALDARDLEIVSVDSPDHGNRPLAYEYQTENNRLVVTLPDRVEQGARFRVRARAVCVPSAHILEGIYKDTTPDGCPQQYVSQCQQWGFQRILPIVDDCRAKCTFTTTLEADAAYTHLISNGNVSRARNPAGRPVPKPHDAARQVITYENPVPMAPYLFVVCVGTWDELADEVTYPSGRKVRLEYLVPRGRAAGARVPLQILKDAVLWQGATQGYEYPGEVYRTICMEKSNFGGMENVGNTTIITDAALIDAYTDDQRLLYAHGVIVHEFEHNQCGSEVTMETPFDMWLNEAYTVDVERQFVASRFDPAFARLREVDAMRMPVLGPLAIEDAGRLGNIVREGFNDPDELVDTVTYVKAAEVINMLRLVLGDEAFARGRALYFSRYRGGNANTDQFFACFEEVSGQALGVFRREWLHTIGYPRIEGAYAYDAGQQRLTIELRQSRAGRGGLFHVPVVLAAVDERGAAIPGTAHTVQIRGERATLTCDGVGAAPAFVSFNQGCSFYGTFKDRSQTTATLLKKARLDPDPIGRVEAVRELTDVERLKLVRDPAAAVGEPWQGLFAELIADETLPHGLKSYLLGIDEEPLDREYVAWYRELYAARRTLMETVAGRTMKDLLEAFERTDTYAPAAHPRDGIESRRLKAVLLGLINAANTPATHALAESHFRRAWNLSDKLAGLAAVHRSDHPARRALMEEAYALWQPHLSAYANYLRLVGSGIHEDVFEMLAAEERRPAFDIRHPTYSRALYLSMAFNNKLLWTDRGIGWMTETVIKLAPVNENTANRLVAAFQHVHRLAADLKPKVLGALGAMRDGIDPGTAPSVRGRVESYLEG